MNAPALHRLILAALLALPAWAAAQSQTSAVPGTISYQGKVLNPSGGLVGAGTPVSRTVIFRVWDHSSNTLAANLLYSEVQTVTIAEGEFSVLVGTGGANPTQTFGYSETTKGPPSTSLANVFNGSSRYLGVTVAAGAVIATTDNEITPRQQIVSSAFAFRAKFAESLGSNGVNAIAAVDGGNVGVGNTSPPSLFTITGANTSLTTNTPQLAITDSTDSNERLLFGVDSTGSGTGFIQATKVGTGPQNLLLNPNGGNVGIGMTTAPTSKLDVTGGIKASGSAGYTFNTGDLDGGLLSPADGILTLLTNNTERLRLDGSGKVGIGTTSPGGPLHVRGSLNTIISQPNAASGTAGLAFWDFGGTERGYIGNAGGANSIIGNSAAGDLVVRATTGNAVIAAVTGNVLINPSSGNVGIGTTSPGGPLHVRGSLNTIISQPNAVTGTAGLAFLDFGGTERGYIGNAGAGGAIVANSAAGDLVVRATTGNAVIAAVTGNVLLNPSSGNVGIGTNTPAAKLHIKALSDNQMNAGIRMEHASDSDFWSIFPENNNNALIFMFGNSYPGGNYSLLNPNSSGFITVSDMRTKKDIEVIRGSLAKVMLLCPKTFRFKTADAGTPLNYGFMAQEVERVYPDVVTENNGLKAIAMNSLIAINTQAIQELKREKDDEVKAVRGENADLKSRLDAQAKRLAELEAKDKARDAKLAAIEKMLGGDKPGARTVSLKKTKADGAE